MSLPKWKLWVCEQTGAIGFTACRAAQERVRDPNVRIAVRCDLRFNGCVCSMDGVTWRRLTDEEAEVWHELEGRRAAHVMDDIFAGRPVRMPPVRYQDVVAVLHVKA